MKFKLQRNFLIHKQSSYENKLSKSISNLLIINVTKQTQRRRRKHTTREMKQIHKCGSSQVKRKTKKEGQKYNSNQNHY